MATAGSFSFLHLARTIAEYALALEEEEEETQQQHQHHQREEEEAAGRCHESFLHERGPQTELEAAASPPPLEQAQGPTTSIRPLLLAQLADIRSALQAGRSAKPQPPAPWSFAYRESSGARAEGVQGLLRLWRRLAPARLDTRGGRGAAHHHDEPASEVLSAVTGCLIALLERDRSYQYLALRLWEEDEAAGSGSGGSLQGFVLRVYAAWCQQGGDPHDQRPSVAERAALLRLWALLAARQPLEVSPVDFPLLADVLLLPVLSATASAAPLSPRKGKARVRDGEPSSPHSQGGEEEGTPNAASLLLLLPSLHVLGHAARASPAFRLFLRALNQRERGMYVRACVNLRVCIR